MDMTGDVISFPVTIDTVAPKLENNAVSIYEKDGRTFITGKIIDEDGSIASVQVAPIVTRSYQDGVGDPNYSQTKPDRANSFYIDNISNGGTKESTFTADVTEYVHKEHIQVNMILINMNGLEMLLFLVGIMVLMREAMLLKLMLQKELFFLKHLHFYTQDNNLS